MREEKPRNFRSSRVGRSQRTRPCRLHRLPLRRGRESATQVVPVVYRTRDICVELSESWPSIGLDQVKRCKVCARGVSRRSCSALPTRPAILTRPQGHLLAADLSWFHSRCSRAYLRCHRVAYRLLPVPCAGSAWGSMNLASAVCTIRRAAWLMDALMANPGALPWAAMWLA